MTEEKKLLLIIDSNALIHRAYHALPPLTDNKGNMVNAVYGFLLIFFKAIKELRPDYIAATFDVPAPTFRHEKFAGYKATRPKAPDDLYSQIPITKEVLNSFKTAIFEKAGFEADDLIGTIANLVFEKKSVPGIETIILTGDSDTFQLINSRTKVCTLRKGLKDSIIYDEEKVKEKYQGLTPHQLLDYKALKGDPSDNIPGVPGVGEKTAIKLIQDFRNLETLYELLEKNDKKWKEYSPRISQCLEDNKDQAFFSRMLVEIKRDVPVDFNLEECCWGDYDEGEVVRLLEDLGFYSLIKRLPAMGGGKENFSSTANNLKLW